MSKKKVAETLSKSEKDFLSKIREILKKDLEENYKSFKIYYEEEFLVFHEKIEQVITAARTDFEDELNKAYTVKEFIGFEQFEGYVNIVQVVGGVKQMIEIEATNFIGQLDTAIREILEEEAEEVLGKVLNKIGASARSIDIFKTDMIKKKYKLKDSVVEEVQGIVDYYLKEVYTELDNLCETVDKETKDLNKHLKGIKMKDEDIELIEIRKTDRFKKIAVCYHDVTVNVIGCYMRRKMTDGIGKDEIKEKAEELKKAIGGYKVIVADNIKMTDGRVLEWNGDNFNIDASTITDRSYSYKDFNKFATERGYKLDRCKGDHAIYTQEGKENVVIPQGRVIGKGLQLKILKDLKMV